MGGLLRLDGRQTELEGTYSRWNERTSVTQTIIPEEMAAGLVCWIWLFSSKASDIWHLVQGVGGWMLT